ncbi:MAG: DHHA1 domain-containing protein [archaeon]
MTEAALKFGGAGGGHAIAAGGRVDPKFKLEFLKELDKAVKKQLS